MFKEELINNIFLIGDEISYPKKFNKKEFAIIYPTDGYYLFEEQFSSIRTSLKRTGLLEVVVGTDIEFLSKNSMSDNLELRDLGNMDYSLYKKDLLLFENSILDSKLRWSISIFQDFWGIIYGPEDLIKEIGLNFDFNKILKKFDFEILNEIRNINTKKTFEEFISMSYNNKVLPLEQQ